MDILVCMKQVPDTETKIVVNPEGTGIVRFSEKAIDPDLILYRSPDHLPNIKP